MTIFFVNGNWKALRRMNFKEKEMANIRDPGSFNIRKAGIITAKYEVIHFNRSYASTGTFHGYKARL